MPSLSEMEDTVAMLIEQGKLRRAERLLKRMLVHDQDCLAAHFHLARVYRRTGEFRFALRHARLALKQNPRERNTYLNLGLIYDVMGRHRLAALFYRKELAINPDSAETLWNLGRLYFKKRQWLRASKHLRHCFDIGFMYEIEDTVDKLGLCYYKLDDVQAYIAVFERYIRLFPRAAWAYVNLGHALFQTRNYKGAALRLSRAVQLGANGGLKAKANRAREMFLKQRQT